jgi:hypothetical protein
MRPDSADRRSGVTEQSGAMTDIPLQITAKQPALAAVLPIRE